MAPSQGPLNKRTVILWESRLHTLEVAMLYAHTTSGSGRLVVGTAAGLA